MIRLVILLLFFSCSLEYDVAVKKLEEQGIPDLVFETAELSRYVDGDLTTKVNADVLEFYGKEDRIYGKNTKFTIYDDNNQITAEGKAALIDANQATENYSLLSGAEIASYAQGMRIKGQNFNWNNKTEQLVAGVDDEVTIEYGTLNNREITLSVVGKGFAASSIGMDYRFTEKSSGSVDTDAQNSSVEENIPMAMPGTGENPETAEGVATSSEGEQVASPEQGNETGNVTAGENGMNSTEPNGETMDEGDIVEN